MMNRFVIVDADGYRVNTVVWDGVTPWDLQPGFTAVPESECTAPARPVADDDA